MAVPITFCWRDGIRVFSWQSHTLVVGVGGRVLMAVSDAGCVGVRGRFHGIPIGWFWGVRLGLSWLSQTLVVDGRGGGSHGSPNPFLWRGWDSGVLMAVSDAGSGIGRGEGSPGSFTRWLLGTVRLGFSWHSQTLVGGGRDHVSHGSLRRWLFVGEAEILMAVPDAGCG